MNECVRWSGKVRHGQAGQAGIPCARGLLLANTLQLKSKLAAKAARRETPKMAEFL